MNSITKQEALYKSIVTLTGRTVKYKPFITSNLFEALTEIATGDNYGSIIEKLRTIEDQNERQNFKLDHLPFFTIGEFQDNERKKNALVQTQFAIYDLDHLNESWDEKWKQIITDKYVFAAFRSPSGDGIKMICKFDKCISNKDLFSELYKHYAKQYSINLGSDPDKTSDCSRACYISYDPTLYLNPDAEALATEIHGSKDSKTQNSDKKQKRDEFISKLHNGCSVGDPRTPVLTQLIGVLMERGFDRDYTAGIALGWNMRNQQPHTDEKIISTVNDIYDRYKSQSITEQTKNFYSYETGIFEARIIGNEFSIKNIGEKKYYIKMNVTEKDDKNKYLGHVVKHNDLHTLKRIDYVSDVSIDKSYYKFDGNEGVFDVHVAPVSIETSDNDFIESYLDEMFGIHKQFIKEWLAVYCYTNYRKLPNLILIGDRGTSKSTFVEMVSGIFPTLSSWTKELEGSFNPDAEKKLVVVDESDSKGKIQYRTLKKYSGQSFIQVNKKYLPQYQVRNNMSLIIMSNDDDAIYVEREEAPTDESNNQFFVHKFKKFGGKIDPDFNKKLLNRIGNYVRTELKAVFNSLSFDGYRYSIPVPITDEEKKLFVNSVTDVEAEADRLVEVFETKMNDVTWQYYNFVKDGYIPTDFFHDNLSSYKVKKSKVILNLKKRGYLTYDNVDKHQTNGRRDFCYKLGKVWLDMYVKVPAAEVVNGQYKTVSASKTINLFN